MKFAAVILVCVAVAANAQFQRFPNFGNNNYFGRNQYNQYRPNQYTAAPAVTVTPAPFPSPLPVARYAANAPNAQILRAGNDINPDGSYSYFYETDNGIAAQEQGTPRNFGGNPPVAPVVAQGSFSWTSPEGEPIAISYIADENGYQPQGSAIPTPPPIPPQIARALEYIARSAPRK